MTAVAGILNKQGVAIAADSAVTVSGLGGRKVYNSANKIFTLSKYHPVGVSIYNSAQFMGIPWEILIKEYRKKLDTKSFPKLINYQTDFFEWLKNNSYFLTEKNIDFLFFDFLSFLQTIINDFIRVNKIKSNVIEQDKLSIFLNEYVKNDIPKHKKIESLKDLNKDELLVQLNTLTPRIIKILNENFNSHFDEENFDTELINAYYEYLIHDQFLQFTGLIFTGYGDTELFPRLFPVNISIVINGLLRYNIDEQKVAIIDNENNSCIRPFAQTDVIDTILQGISPELNDLSSNVFGDFMNGFVNEIRGIKGMPQQVKEQLGKLNIQDYVNNYQSQFGNIIRQKYVNPLMGAVSQLSKEDLAEMAESLVYLTYLKRRFTMAEESVGGPVDIAVITKGDGFIWIKRKHYFKPELNQSFFKKYL
jgi:hypothetical protein